MSKKRPARLRYTGKGDLFFAGVPARNLEAEDIALLSEETIANITAEGPSGKALYVVIEDEPKATETPKATPKTDTKQAGGEPDRKEG